MRVHLKPMDHVYDDDRPTDAHDAFDTGEPAPPALPPDEFAFEAPDLASAFLAALDAVDDRRFVAPTFDDLLSDELTTPEPAAAAPVETDPFGLDPLSSDWSAAPSVPDPAVSQPVAHAAEPAATEPEPQPEPAYETPDTMMLRLQPLEAGTLELPASDELQGADAIAAASDEPAADVPAASEDYVIEHDPAAYAAADDTPSSRAVAEAFAREQAALELWGSDEASAALESAAADEASSEYAASAEAVDSIESIEANLPVPEPALGGWSASVNIEQPLTADLVAETVSNADSYYDPDTLRLSRPLFSPDEPRAFVEPVYVGETPDAAEADASVDATADPEAEVLEDLEEFVAFSLGDTRCVVPIRNVIEIGRIPNAVAVPNAPAWLHGLGNLRGQVLSLIDLRAFLGIGRVRPATGRMLVLRGDDDEVQAGLLVDHVHQIVSLSASRFHPVPETLARHYARHAWGVCDYGNFTMIGLEVDSLLGVENMTPLGEAAEVA